PRPSRCLGSCAQSGRSWEPTGEHWLSMAGPLGGAPSVTVVLPTYRRDAALGRALAALARQTDPGVPWNLVVVDNDDAPGSEATVRAAAESFPVPVRVVHERRRGASSARNRGIAEASGTIVAF